MAHDVKEAARMHHPSGWTYVKVGALLTIITAVEVWLYYIPAAVASPLFNPTMLAMSAAKFAIVVMFYMHLKYDSKVFSGIFLFPLALAALVISGLFLLYHVLHPLR